MIDAEQAMLLSVKSKAMVNELEPIETIIKEAAMIGKRRVDAELSFEQKKALSDYGYELKCLEVRSPKKIKMYSISW